MQGTIDKIPEGTSLSNGGENTGTSSSAVGGETVESPKISEKVDMSYESKREMLKLGLFMSAYLMFQSTVGISVFCLHKPMHDAGLLWSLVISIVCCYITTYGLLNVLTLVSKIEKDNQLTKRCPNLYSATRYLKGPHILYMKWAMTIASVGMMLSSSVSNLILVTQSLHYVMNKYECTFVVWLIISGLLVVIIEPEKLKNFTTVTTALVMLVAASFTFINFYDFLSGKSEVTWKDIPLVNFKNTFGLTGNLIYAFELCSCYLSLRLTAKESVDYKNLTVRMMMIITSVYFLAGASFSLEVKGEHMHENAFRIHDKGILRFASLTFMVNTVYNFITNAIFACEAFETNGWVRLRLVDAQGRVKRQNIVSLRILMWTAIAIFSLICGDRVTKFLNFSGSVFSPMVGFIGPLVYNYTYSANRGEKILPIKKLHDSIYLGVCLLISTMGIIHVFND